MKHLLLAGCLIALLSACTTAPDTPHAPDTPPAAAITPGDQPLSSDAAVRLALLGSPALKALLAQSEAQADQLRARSRPGLLSLSWTRLQRGDATELDRSLSVGLLELLTWPWRSQAADQQIAAIQQQQAIEVLTHAQAVRRQWVRAVAAQQRLSYEDDVLNAAQTSAELARRMQATGQFSAAQAAQEAASEAEARLNRSLLHQQALREREALVRLIGLQGQAAQQLRLPPQLPTVPTELAWTPETLAEAARQRRLDTRLAEARWQASRDTGQDAAWRSAVDVDIGRQRNQASGEPPQNGNELQLRLASIDFGAASRRAARHEEQAALSRWQQTTLAAESNLRTRWADYLASHDSALRARDQLLVLRQQVLGERLKQYNGMLIGPFELLAEARAHVGSMLTALDAQRDFWLADAQLNAALDGVDDSGTTPSPDTGL